MSKDSPNRKRKNRLSVYANDAELTMIHDRMDRCGYHNLGEYARRMMIDGCFLVIDDREELKAFTFEINKIGNNINQIAHVANTSGSVNEKQIEELKEMMHTIWQYQRYILSATPS